MEKIEIVKEFKRLTGQKEIEAIQTPILQFSYEPIINYLENISLKGKPETAAGELLRSLIQDLIQENCTAEVDFLGDYVDFVITENGMGNPLCIELKPFLRYNRKKDTIYQSDFKYEIHQKQIQKYLRHKRIEYVILTNLNKAYIFNRAAIIKFEPFFVTNLPQIFEDFLLYENLWDVLRRYEDKQAAKDLDIQFFNDLKKWFNEFDLANVNFIENHSISREEIIVLLLNKLIFIKTLEDHGLIAYRFLQDQYERFVDLWKPKGYHNVLSRFFQDIESFFENYYNTELFASNFWDFVDKDRKNVERFKKVFELILGLDNWSKTFEKGIVHYNYRQINEDIFGKAYETWIAENRKDEGIYYTPVDITEYMSKKIVDVLFEIPVQNIISELKQSNPHFEKLNLLIEDFLSIRVIDSTSGSGSFLIKVFRNIFNYYQLLNEATRWVEKISKDDLFDVPENIKFIINFRKKLSFDEGNEIVQISKILLHHIFAADKDERAIDTAKVNLWKEAIKIHPNIYNFRKLEEFQIHILPNLEMNFIRGDSLIDYDFSKQIEIITNEFKNEIIKLHEIRDEYLSNPFTPEIIKEYKEIKNKIRKRLLEEDSNFKNTLFFPLEFFYCFFKKDGSPMPEEKHGFSGIISNPPWEAIKPIKKEFAKQGKYEMDILHFNKWFKEKLSSDTEFSNDWKNYNDFYERYSEFLYEKYKLQSSGDPNYYKFFIERDFQLIKQNAYFCLLVPSGFQTDAGSILLRDLLINQFTLNEIKSFENRGYFAPDKKFKVKLFPEVDNRFKFSIVFAQKKHRDETDFNAKFYMRHPNELKENDIICYDIDKIKKFSPHTISIMEFRTERDYEICLKIRGEFKLFAETHFKLRSEFHMTNDSHLYNSLIDIQNQKGVPFLRLYEGKMIHQFTSSYGEPRYFIKEIEARKVLFKKVLHRIKQENELTSEDFKKLSIPDDLLMDYQTYRFVYRAIASSTNERTLICSIVPPKTFIGHSMNFIVNLMYAIEDNKVTSHIVTNQDLVYILSIFNSLTLNYYVRNKVSANLTMNFIYELPIADASEEIKTRIVELGFNLLYKKSNKLDFEDLKNELNITKEINKDENEIRAELEVIIAKHLYQLSFDDWQYISSTFTFGGESDTKAELDEVISKSIDLWDIF
ncbi:MAG TPA: hypothetical protein PKY56_02480 [Candidatus Kapabacteria bacterium]|nr:hypothetical protein [Candidatus Kapabacteria bacterium]